MLVLLKHTISRKIIIMKNYQKKILSSILSSALIVVGTSLALATNANAKEVYPDGIHFSDDEIYPVERLDDYTIEEEIADQYSNDGQTGNDNVKSDEPLRTSTDLVDTDGDGIPDEWEKNGFVNDQGKLFPLDEWGADPYRPDIFLQLNWMHPDPRVGQEDMYAPERSSLDKLVDLFDKNGYNLHIDAGEAYNNIPNSESYGGQTVPFKDIYITEFDHPALLLEYQRMDQLKDRSGLFHSGVIVKKVNSRNNGGVGTINGGSFTVQSLSDEYLHHIILHELGHNLGLSHYGPVGKIHIETPLNDEYLPNYRSEMNYIYSYGQFDYTHQVTYSSSNLPVECLYTRLKCYTGKYEVASDWDNISLKNPFIGRFNGKTAEKDAVQSVNKTHNVDFKDNSKKNDGNSVKTTDQNTVENTDVETPGITTENDVSEKTTVQTTMKSTPMETTSQRVDRKSNPETTKEVSPTMTRQVKNNDSRSQQVVTISTIIPISETPTSLSTMEKETSRTGEITEENSVDSHSIKTSVEKITPTSESIYEDNKNNNLVERKTNSQNNVIQNIIFALGTALATIGVVSLFGYFISGFM